jgi:subtilase family serine protease
MRCLALLSSPKLSTTLFTTFILSLLILSNQSFAAAPDRIAGPIDSRQTTALPRSLHPQARPQYDRGPVEPSREFGYLTMVTAPSASQQKALDQLLAEQQDRTSPNYHKWLTPQQYADRFGLSPNDLNRITTWLTSQGFHTLSIAGGRNSTVFSGTASEVQQAFGAEIHSYVVNGKEHFANATPLMIPSALNGIVTGVIGLNSFGPQPSSHARNFGGARNSRHDYYDGNFVFPNFLAPGDIATIYDITSLYDASTPIDGTRQTLAIIGQTDVYMADITDFRSGFGLNQISGCTLNSSGVVTACDSTYFKYVPVGSDPGTPYSCGDLSEADLDIEWSGATARNAQIVYVNSPIVYDSNCNYVSGGGVNTALIAAIDPSSGPVAAPVVSMSYGICEAEAEDLETYLQQGNAEGVTILNSAGDEGAAGCDYSPPNNASNPPFDPAEYGLAVSYPASSPEVTGVGGTAISLANDSYPNQSPYWSTSIGSNGGTAVSYIPELAWNDDEELADYCHDPAQGDTFCSTGGDTSGWVALTTSATAEQVQEDIWISIGGGGASNCITETEEGVCEAGFSQPTWQQGLSVPSAPAGVRYVPDVSLLASPDFPGYIWCTPLSELGEGGSTSSCSDGIYSAVNTYESIVGGTSASSPIFAGIVTLLNQYVVVNGIQSAPGLGNINPTLYSIAANNQTAFHQVTTGDNMVYCQPGTPAGQPSAIVCPSAGVFGYDASNKDSATGYNLVTGLGSVDANNLATAWVGASKTATSITIQASPTQVSYGQTVSLTATVAPSTATGTVSFFNNGSTTALGTATLSNGVATFTTTTLPVGTDSLSASYGGDANDSPSSTTTSATVTVTAPTFTLTNTGSTSHTALAGQTTLAYTFVATPTSASAFAAAVTFGCTFAPTDTTLTSSSCVFSPASIAAGASATTVSMAIGTTGPNSGTGTQLRRRADKRSLWLPLALPIAGVVMVGFWRRKMSKCSVIAGLCFTLTLFGLLVACGGGSNPVSVTVSPSTASLWPNDTTDDWPSSIQAFTATVSNTSNTAVTWSISPSEGSIDSSGAYTAPTVAAGLTSPVTVTATSQADSTKTATATITLKTATIPQTYSVTMTATETTTTNPLTYALVVQ